MKSIYHPHWTLHVLLLVAIICSAAGCAVLQDLSKFEKPTASISSLSIKNLNLNSATLLFDVDVQNPYSFPLPLTTLDYNLATGGSSFLSGKADLQGSVPSLSKKTISLPIEIRYLETLKALGNIRPGALVPYESELGLSVSPLAGTPLRLPLRKSGQLPVPAVPEVSLTSIQWDKLDIQKVSGLASLRMVNPNQFPFDLSKISYALALGGMEVANTSLLKQVSFSPSGGNGTIQIPVSFSPMQAGMSIISLVSGKGSSYSLRGSAEGKTPFGPMAFPIDKSGQTVFSR